MFTESFIFSALYTTLLVMVVASILKFAFVQKWHVPYLSDWIVFAL